MKIQLKRIYEPYSSKDGYRVLVDKLWPRGVKKEDAHIDLWMKEAAPSTALRKWFHSGEGSWTEFKRKYKAELTKSEVLPEFTAQLKKHKLVTFVFGAKDEEHNHAMVLREYIILNN